MIFPVELKWTLVEATFTLYVSGRSNDYYDEGFAYWGEHGRFRRVSPCCGADVRLTHRDGTRYCCIKCREIMDDWYFFSTSTAAELLSEWDIRLDAFQENLFVGLLESQQSFMDDWWLAKDKTVGSSKDAEQKAWRSFEALEPELNAELKATIALVNSIRD